MNPFLLKLPNNLEGYDNLKTESSKDDSNSKKSNINSNSNEINSDDKINEFNPELPSKSNENNPSGFRASYPLDSKDEKKKRCSKAFERFKKRYSAVIIEDQKKVKASDKIKNIVAMLEKQMKGGNVDDKKEEEKKKKEITDKRNTVTQDEILLMRKTLGKIQKKKGQRPSVVDIV